MHADPHVDCGVAVSGRDDNRNWQSRQDSLEFGSSVGSDVEYWCICFEKLYTYTEHG